MKTLVFLLVFNFLTFANTDVIGIDVRTWPERKFNPAPNSLAISNGELEEQIEQRNIPKDKKIVIFCEAGVRAERGMEILQKLGYKNVKNIGSWRDWNKDYAQKAEKKEDKKEEKNNSNE
jgi:rhodanese-related sulfurtransferase